MTKPCSETGPTLKPSFYLLLASSIVLLITLLFLSGCGGGTSGQGGPLVVSPNVIDFGVTDPNGTQISRVINLTNIAAGKVKIESISLSPASVFQVQNWTGAVTLEPGGTFKLHLTFAPKTPGNYSGVLLVSASLPWSQNSSSGKGVKFVSAVWNGSATGRQSPLETAVVHYVTNVAMVGKRSSPDQANGNGGGGNGGGGNGNGGGNSSVVVSPPSAVLQGGQTVQFTANQSVSWSAVLGTVSAAGLYTAPKLASQSVDTVTAVALNNSSNYGSASVVVQGTGTAGGGGPQNTQFTIKNPPPATWYPYDPTQSLNNKPLPADVLQHCYGNTADCSAGDAIAQYTATNNGAVHPPYTHQSFIGDVYFPNTAPNGNGSDVGLALYYGQATDPWYKIDGCHYDSQLSVRFHAPNNAVAGGLPGNDQHFAVYDVAQGILIEGYGFDPTTGVTFPDASSCPGTGSNSCAMAVTHVGACSAERVGVDNDLDSAGHYDITLQGNTYTLGGTSTTGLFSAMANMVRQQEVMSGTINHALALGAYCTADLPWSSTYVWPATSGLNPCPSYSPSQPKAGMLLFCDYTPAQISAMRTAGQISTAQATFLTTFCQYGGYIMHTGGDSWAGMKLVGSGGYESQSAYQRYYNYDNGFESWACAQGMNDFGQAACSQGVLTGNYGPSLHALGGIPLMTGPEGQDSSGRSCTVAPGCDVTGHIHVADPCVAKALAGLPGGCQ